MVMRYGGVMQSHVSHVFLCLINYYTSLLILMNILYWKRNVRLSGLYLEYIEKEMHGLYLEWIYFHRAKEHCISKKRPESHSSPFQDLNPIFYFAPFSDQHWVVSEQVAHIVDQKKGRNLPPFLPKVSTRLKVRGNCLFQYFCNKSELTSLPGQPMTNLG